MSYYESYLYPKDDATIAKKERATISQVVDTITRIPLNIDAAYNEPAALSMANAHIQQPTGTGGGGIGPPENVTDVEVESGTATIPISEGGKYFHVPITGDTTFVFDGAPPQEGWEIVITMDFEWSGTEAPNISFPVSVAGVHDLDTTTGTRETLAFITTDKGVNWAVTNAEGYDASVVDLSEINSFIDDLKNDPLGTLTKLVDEITKIASGIAANVKAWLQDNDGPLGAFYEGLFNDPFDSDGTSMNHTVTNTNPAYSFKQIGAGIYSIWDTLQTWFGTVSDIVLSLLKKPNSNPAEYGLEYVLPNIFTYINDWLDADTGILGLLYDLGKTVVTTIADLFKNPALATDPNATPKYGLEFVVPNITSQLSAWFWGAVDLVTDWFKNDDGPLGAFYEGLFDDPDNADGTPAPIPSTSKWYPWVGYGTIVRTWATEIGLFFANPWGYVSGKVMDLAGTLAAGLGMAYSDLQTWFGDVGAKVTAFLGDAWGWLVDNVDTLLTDITGLLGPTWVNITTFLGGLTTEIISAFATTWESLTSFVGDAWTWLTDNVDTLLADITGLLGQTWIDITTFLGNLGQTVIDAFAATWTTLTGWYDTISNAVLGVFRGPVKPDGTYPYGLEYVWPNITSYFETWLGNDTGILGVLYDIGTSTFDKILSLFKQKDSDPAVYGIQYVVPNLSEAILGLVTGAAANVKAWLQDDPGPLGAFYEGLTGDSTNSDGTDDPIPTTDPSYIFVTVGSVIHEFAESIKTLFANPAAWVASITGIAATIGDIIGTSVSTITTFFTDVAAKVTTFIGGLTQTIIDTFATTWTSISSFIDNPWTFLIGISVGTTGFGALITGVLTGPIPALISFFSATDGTADNTIAKVLDRIKERLGAAWTWAETTLKATGRAILDAITGFFTYANGAITGITTSFLALFEDGILGDVKTAIETAGTAIHNAIVALIGGEVEGANKTLSNLSGTTAINQTLGFSTTVSTAGADGSRSIGYNLAGDLFLKSKLDTDSMFFYASTDWVELNPNLIKWNKDNNESSITLTSTFDMQFDVDSLDDKFTFRFGGFAPEVELFNYGIKFGASTGNTSDAELGQIKRKYIDANNDTIVATVKKDGTNTPVDLANIATSSGEVEGANKTLSNLATNTTINSDLKPMGHSQSLGSRSADWNVLYVQTLELQRGSSVPSPVANGLLYKRAGLTDPTTDDVYITTGDNTYNLTTTLANVSSNTTFAWPSGKINEPIQDADQMAIQRGEEVPAYVTIATLKTVFNTGTPLPPAGEGITWPMGSYVTTLADDDQILINDGTNLQRITVENFRNVMFDTTGETPFPSSWPNPIQASAVNTSTPGADQMLLNRGAQGFAALGMDQLKKLVQTEAAGFPGTEIAVAASSEFFIRNNETLGHVTLLAMARDYLLNYITVNGGFLTSAQLVDWNALTEYRNNSVQTNDWILIGNVTSSTTDPPTIVSGRVSLSTLVSWLGSELPPPSFSNFEWPSPDIQTAAGGNVVLARSSKTSSTNMSLSLTTLATYVRGTVPTNYANMALSNVGATNIPANLIPSINAIGPGVTVGNGLDLGSTNRYWEYAYVRRGIFQTIKVSGTPKSATNNGDMYLSSSGDVIVQSGDESINIRTGTRTLSPSASSLYGSDVAELPNSTTGDIIKANYLLSIGVVETGSLTYAKTQVGFFLNNTTINSIAAATITDTNKATYKIPIIEPTGHSAHITMANLETWMQDNLNFQAGSGEANTASNLGTTGSGVYASKSGVDLRFKRLIGGTNVTISSGTNALTISATGSGSTTYTPAYADFFGTGITLITSGDLQTTDQLLVGDHSQSALRRMRMSTLISFLNDNLDFGTGGGAPTYDNLFGDTIVESNAIDATNDFIIYGDASASTIDKINPKDFISRLFAVTNSTITDTDKLMFITSTGGRRLVTFANLKTALGL